MKTLRAIRRHDPISTQRCLRKYPTLQELATQGPQALCDHAASLANEQAITELRHITGAEKEEGHDLPEPCHRRQHLMVKLKKLAPGRSVTISAIKPQGGRITAEETEVSDGFRQHWQQVFGRSAASWVRW